MTKRQHKTELVVDNNLLWRSKAYSFGHFVRDLCGDPTHVQNASSPFPHQCLLLIAAWDVNLHHSLLCFDDTQMKELVSELGRTSKLNLLSKTAHCRYAPCFGTYHCAHG